MTQERVFDTFLKRSGMEANFEDEMWEAYWQGYKLGMNVEELTDLDEKSARSEFTRWYEQNYL